MSRRFAGQTYDGGFWFRVYGYGLSVQDRTKHPALFSERNGYRKVYRIGRYAIEFLVRRDSRVYEIPESESEPRVSNASPPSVTGE